MTLEDLVPPLELCKQIPYGKFEDSACVWAVNGSSYFIEQRELMEYALRSRIVAPAPTLQEILDEIARQEMCPGLNVIIKPNGETVYSIYATLNKMIQGNPAESALKLWMSVTSDKSDKSVENPQ